MRIFFKQKPIITSSLSLFIEHLLRFTKQYRCNGVLPLIENIITGITCYAYYLHVILWVCNQSLCLMYEKIIFKIKYVAHLNVKRDLYESNEIDIKKLMIKNRNKNFIWRFHACLNTVDYLLISLSHVLGIIHTHETYKWNYWKAIFSEFTSYAQRKYVHTYFTHALHIVWLIGIERVCSCTFNKTIIRDEVKWLIKDSMLKQK